MSVTKARLKKIVLSFPLAMESVSYGKPSFHVGKKFFTRLREEDNSIVIIVGSMDERDMLLESDRKLFHITDHYKDWPTVLLRLDKADSAMVRGFLERRWRAIAPKKLLKEPDTSAPPPEKLQAKKPKLKKKR
ncbi:MAG TPA: MmcQ/YjbR family DNA-binding protein [Rhizomicrobium sp.]|jgi:hypothetical protein|nr:MmcQ/YjbR family DNA-binding protein [Rhizomicrobium sp.]